MLESKHLDNNYVKCWSEQMFSLNAILTRAQYFILLNCQASNKLTITILTYVRGATSITGIKKENISRSDLSHSSLDYNGAD